MSKTWTKPARAVVGQVRRLSDDQRCRPPLPPAIVGFVGRRTGPVGGVPDGLCRGTPRVAGSSRRRPTGLLTASRRRYSPRTDGYRRGGETRAPLGAARGKGGA